MSGEVYLDSDAVRGAAAELGEINNSIRAELQSVTAEIDALLTSGWSGTAADFFRGHYHDLTQHARQIIDDAGAITDLVSVAVANTGQTDQMSGTTISHLSL